jgi:hypothetical protein
MLFPEVLAKRAGPSGLTVHPTSHCSDACPENGSRSAVVNTLQLGEWVARCFVSKLLCSQVLRRFAVCKELKPFLD